jgi:Alpha amylase, catalytic domain
MAIDGGSGRPTIIGPAIILSQAKDTARARAADRACLAFSQLLSIVCCTASLCASSAALIKPAEADVILQIFESRYTNIEHRMPDIFMAGYDALWIPPVGRASSADGAGSVGYDPFNRFDLGSPGKPTLYGTREQLQELIREAHKANVAVYADAVHNHNGFSNLGTPGFLASGDYPGFVLTLPQAVDGDFHNGFLTSDQNEIEGRLGGEIDICQECNFQFIRHPVDPADSRNIPGEPALESNRQFYPDTDPTSPPQLGNTSGDRHTPSGFNLDHPMAGDPVSENATGLLLRNSKWMIEVIGVDGLRLDAAKHVPAFYWRDFYDDALFRIGPGGSTPFSFGEVIAGSSQDDINKLRAYTCKNGIGNCKDRLGNRDVLDFPLYFKMHEVLNGSGNGNMGDLVNASVDGIDGDANDGTIGVLFVSNHDDGAPPPAADNIAYAHILTRTGYPIVYFNALDVQPRNFPRDGRGDALGGQFGTLITTLVDIHDEYARGRYLFRHADGDAYIYERDRALIVGLNDDKTFDADRTVQTSFPGGTTLVELTGNPCATNPLVIKADGTATLKIPNDGNDRGYAIWGPKAPRGSTTVNPFTITPLATVIPPDGSDVPNGRRRLTPIERITAGSATLTLTLEDENLDDRAFVRVDDGRTNVIGTPIFGEGDFKGFQTFTTSDPGFTGQGVYSASLDVSKLNEGVHYIEAVAFLRRNPDLPPVFRTFRKVILVDR